MNINRVKAIAGSVEKWEGILNGGEDCGTDNCTLCKRYYHRDLRCVSCPISDYIGEKWCEKTPYEQWRSHQAWKHGGPTLKVQCDKCRELALNELLFLYEVLVYELGGKI